MVWFLLKSRKNCCFLFKDLDPLRLAQYLILYVPIHLLEFLLLLAEVPIFSLRICKDSDSLWLRRGCSKLVCYVANVCRVGWYFCVQLFG